MRSVDTVDEGHVQANWRKMTTRSEHILLAVTTALIVAGVAVSLLKPPASATGSPRAVLELPEAFFRTASTSASVAPPQSSSGAVINVATRRAPHRAVSLHTAQALDATFSRLGYDLDRIRLGDQSVPRLYLASLPRDLSDLIDIKQRKSLFFRTVLPLILSTNERILKDRNRLWTLRAEKRLGQLPSATDRLWLAVMADRYGVDRDDLEGLLARVDIIPPSLALAQGAEESGWGTSRFAREGNAIFGQWTFDASGVVPSRREDGKTHRVKAFKQLSDSVAAYALNLNTHRAYRKFRKIRSGLRRKGTAVEGLRLLQGLDRYSERGTKYIKTIRTIIVANDLRRLDEARLGNASFASQPAI